MKKSDAVAKLVGYLIDQERESDQKINVNKTELVKYMLDCCERIGMSPPEISRNLSQEEADINGLSTEDVIFMREWERENG